MASPLMGGSRPGVQRGREGDNGDTEWRLTDGKIFSFQPKNGPNYQKY